MSAPCYVVKKQDMPPAGGYKPIPYKRLPAKQLFSGYQILAGYVVMTIGAAYLFYLTKRKIKKHEIELRSNKMAIYPALLAERDREFLKQLNRNRAEEAKIMKDVPNWEVGKYYNEKVYKTMPDEVLMTPIFHDYYVHCDPNDWFQRTDIKLWA